MWKDLDAWLRARPLWLRDAARRIVQEGPLTETDVDELCILCKSDAGVATDGRIVAKPLEIREHTFTAGGLGGAPGPKVRLHSIGGLKGINALSPRNPLEFGEQPITIVYGRNGSGKSGYVRVLKHACGARNAGNLLNNVFSPSSVQECTITASTDGQVREYAWTPKDGIIDQLRTIAVFDGKCTNTYVQQDNEVTYEPPVLEFFDSLVKACTMVAARLQQEVNLSVSAKPSLPAGLRETESGLWYASINSATSEGEVASKCLWTEELESRVDDLGQRLAQHDPTETARQMQITKATLDALVGDLTRMRDTLSDLVCTDYLAAKQNAQVKRKAADEDAKRVFVGSPLPGVGSESWRLLWEKAREYSESQAYRGLEYPYVGEGSRCVLCQQPLQPEGRDRMRDFESYVRGELEKDARTAEEGLARLSAGMIEVPSIETVDLRLRASGITDEGLQDKVSEYCSLLRNRRESVIDARTVDDITSLPSEDVLESLKSESSRLQGRIAVLLEDAKGENRPDLQREKNGLVARRWLSQQREAVLEDIARLRRIAGLQEAIRKTATTSISTKKASLAEAIVTADYIKRFNDELGSLHASNIKAEMARTRTQHGRILHRVVLKGITQAATLEVLSEGEQRVVSLAAFIADVQGSGGSSAFVFDDPISSLDLEYEKATAARLIELAKSHQVIVFTHRLSLLSQLQSEAGKREIDSSVVCLRAEPWGTGEPGETALREKHPDRALNALKGKRLSDARKVYEQKGTAKYEPLAKAICSDFRIILERIIEFNLFNDIVERFRPDIQTKSKLVKVGQAITAEDCSFLDTYMTKYSAFEHAQPGEAPVPLPLPDELGKDIDKMIDWIRDYRDRLRD